MIKSCHILRWPLVTLCAGQRRMDYMYIDMGVVESHVFVGLPKVIAGIGNSNARDDFPSQSQTYVILY